MSADAVVLDGVPQKIVIVKKTLGSENSLTSDDTKIIVLGVAFSVVGGIIFFIVLLCLCKRRRRRNRLRKNDQEISSSSTSTTNTSPPVFTIRQEVQLRTTEDVTRRYERSISSLSTKSQVYLVPFAVLPPDFDFSSREVEVKADYVILKDLRFLEKYKSSDNSRGVVNEAYEQQESYNPYIYGTIPPLVEAYKKQEPYNPTFY
ncbi:unnamed protein product [Ceutorhynchus assimilis]|uniref:Uncharacterized protein n=1 Tax=Ceutorhynchus assimilis TaxID=467358 RepID=A0A9N9MMP2_9CUCU|nr:unnamed protein product [Ceutorhynchus assimilis]